MRPLAVFDIDGTLVDSRVLIHEAAVAGARAVGLPDPTYDEVRQTVGLSLPVAMRALAPDIPDAALDRFVAGFQAYFRAHYDAGREEPLYPGVDDMLRRLRKDGWRLALATGQNRRGVARNLARAGWGDTFISAHCAEDGPGKPDPTMLRAAMTACRACVATTVMIGDTGHDHRMAVNAGVPAYGVAWGFNTAEEQLAAGAALVATDWPELEAALDRLAVQAVETA